MWLPTMIPRRHHYAHAGPSSRAHALFRRGSRLTTVSSRLRILSILTFTILVWRVCNKEDAPKRDIESLLTSREMSRYETQEESTHGRYLSNVRSRKRSHPWKPAFSDDAHPQWTGRINLTYPLPLAEHPIYALVEAAEDEWMRKQTAVSQTLRQTRATYMQKYGKIPPQGFDEWYAFAKSNGYRFIDEHDLLMEKLQPFSNMPPELVRRRTWEVGMKETFSLVHVENGTVWIEQTRPSHHSKKKLNDKRARGLATMLEQFAHLLPDVTFAVNELAQPRVILPWDGSGSTAWSHDEVLKYPNALLEGEESGWHSYRKTCPPFSAARGPAGWESAHLRPIGLKSATIRKKVKLTAPAFQQYHVAYSHSQICENPDLHLLHSQFFGDYRPVEGVWPVFTVNTAEGYGDIPFPSDYYLENNYTAKYHLAPDGSPKTLEWSKRSDKIYWRGATNPGYNTPPHHQVDFPRRRFLEMSSTHHKAERQLNVLVPGQSSGEEVVHLSQLNSTGVNARIMDVAFTGVWNCGPPDECASIKKGHYRILKREPVDNAQRYKMLLDLDGLAYSARFKTLMESGGAIIRSTLYQEYFSEWVQPWYHYIPLTNEFEDIYSLHAFFLGQLQNGSASPSAKKREKMLEDIARHGQQWVRDFGRQSDLQVYVLRMALEWCRLYRGQKWEPRSPDPYAQEHRLREEETAKSAQRVLYFAEEVD